ncbi:MAG: SOS cell division inhibitor SulA [Proteobacteria bacterium]|nr:MAG: SOS cell division inhibitor SulA [Pseudomonadota bacterium]
MNKHTDLLNHTQMWQGTQARSRLKTVSTGFHALDRLLPGEGWPKGCVIELILPSPGIGELRLLVPLLNKLTREQDKWILWVAPPHNPYGPSLQQYGIRPENIILVRSNDLKEQLWAMEQGLKSGLCSAVLGWPRRASPTHIRRLQLCADNQGNHCFVFHSLQAGQTNSPAPLKILLSACTQTADTSRLRIKMLKRRGSWPMQQAKTISLSPYSVTSWPAEGKYAEQSDELSAVARSNKVVQGPWNTSCYPFSEEG